MEEERKNKERWRRKGDKGRWWKRNGRTRRLDRVGKGEMAEVEVKGDGVEQ
jgi:hypothetical protein